MIITDERIDEYLNELNIELLPHQKEIFKKISSDNPPRITIPPKFDRIQVLGLVKIYEVMDEIGFLEELLEE